MAVWTTQDDDTLRRMYAFGATRETVAATLKRTKEAVSARASSLGVRLSDEVRLLRRAEAMTNVNRSPEQRERCRKAKLGKDSRLAWCPEHLRAEYKKLAKKDGFNAASARAIMESSYKLKSNA